VEPPLPTACVEDVAKWMSANRLQLNVAKTEFLWCSCRQRLNANKPVAQSLWVSWVAGHPNSSWGVRQPEKKLNWNIIPTRQ